jgi:phage replication-related protein YjqB (UPF0714/DUF867 family)
MADKYSNFAELSLSEVPGIDFGILVRQARTAFAVVAPHGGGIEPGTSEIADAIAAGEFSFYAFEGLKSSGNADLHITSTRFDEPMCLTVVSRSTVVLTIHGEHSEADGEGVFLGGLDKAGPPAAPGPRSEGLRGGPAPDPRLQGRERKNLCNRGACGKGVQLELSRAVRTEMFSSLSREGRKQTTPRFCDFVGALRGVLDDDL